MGGREESTSDSHSQKRKKKKRQRHSSRFFRVMKVMSIDIKATAGG
jgi:hypothetical protein